MGLVTHTFLLEVRVRVERIVFLAPPGPAGYYYCVLYRTVGQLFILLILQLRFVLFPVFISFWPPRKIVLHLVQIDANYPKHSNKNRSALQHVSGSSKSRAGQDVGNNITMQSKSSLLFQAKCCKLIASTVCLHICDLLL